LCQTDRRPVGVYSRGLPSRLISGCGVWYQVMVVVKAAAAYQYRQMHNSCTAVLSVPPHGSCGCAAAVLVHINQMLQGQHDPRQLAKGPPCVCRWLWCCLTWSTSFVTPSLSVSSFCWPKYQKSGQGFSVNWKPKSLTTSVNFDWLPWTNSGPTSMGHPVKPCNCVQNTFRCYTCKLRAAPREAMAATAGIAAAEAAAAAAVAAAVLQT